MLADLVLPIATLATFALGASAQAGAGGFPMTPLHGCYWGISDESYQAHRFAFVMFLEGQPGWLETAGKLESSVVGGVLHMSLPVGEERIEIALDFETKALRLLDQVRSLEDDNVFVIRGVDGGAPTSTGLGLHELPIASDTLPSALLRDAAVRGALTSDPVSSQEEADADSPASRKLREGMRLLEKGPRFEDSETAFRLILEAAEEGLAEAQYQLADCYNVGCFGAADEERAMAWYKKAAEQGDTRAMMRLVFFYDEEPPPADGARRSGRTHAGAAPGAAPGAARDEEQALEWLKRAADAGVIWGQQEVAQRMARREEREAKVTAYQWIRVVELQLAFFPSGERQKITDLAGELRLVLSEEERRAADDLARDRLVRYTALRIPWLARGRAWASFW